MLDSREASIYVPAFLCFSLLFPAFLCFSLLLPAFAATLQLGYVGYENIPTMGQLGSTILILLMAMAGFAGYRRLYV